MLTLGVGKVFISVHFSKQDILSSFTFLIYLSNHMKGFYLEHKTMSLNQCDNQKNYSSVCYRIEEEDMEMQLIFTFFDI